MAMNIPGFDLTSFLKFTMNPTDTQSILDVQKSMLGAPNRAQMINGALESIDAAENFKELYKKHYMPDFPSTQKLLAYNKDTLGFAVGKHLNDNSIELDFAGLDVSMFYSKDMSPLAYFGIRGIRTHDILHALLGLGVTPVDEYTVATFTLAQFKSPYHMVLVSSGYIHTAFYEPEQIGNFLKSIHKYYELGMKAEFVMGYPFEDNFATPLADVRKALKLEKE